MRCALLPHHSSTIQALYTLRKPWDREAKSKLGLVCSVNERAIKLKKRHAPSYSPVAMLSFNGPPDTNATYAMCVWISIVGAKFALQSCCALCQAAVIALGAYLPLLCSQARQRSSFPARAPSHPLFLVLRWPFCIYEFAIGCIGEVYMILSGCFPSSSCQDQQ